MAGFPWGSGMPDGRSEPSDTTDIPAVGVLSRRAFVLRLSGGLLASAVGVPLLAACTSAAPSTPAAPTRAPASAPTSAPAAASSPAAAASPAVVTSPVAAPSAAAGAAPSPVAAGSGSPSAPVSIGGVRLPTYTQVQGPKPDLPGSADGNIEPGYYSYPKTLFKAVPNPPGKGGDISLTTFTTQPPAPPVDQNPAWQAINKDVGANLMMSAVPFADYATKFATLISSNQLTDIFYVLANGSTIQGFPQFLDSQCADLTPYLSGDAVKDYPNLANLPTFSWAATIFSGKIYGVPVPYVPFTYVTYVQQTLLDQDGVSFPKNADDWKQSLQTLTHPQQDVYGIGAENNVAGGITEDYPLMQFRTPNNWAVDSNGQFTKDWETPEYKAALAYVVDLWKAGVYTPKTSDYNNVNAKADFANRKFAYRYDGWAPSSLQYWNTGVTLSPPSVVKIPPPWAADGGKPVYFLGAGSRSFSMLKKASPDRVKELLGVLNWLASPFGSMEYELQYYGVKGTDFTLDDKGNPILTKQGTADVAVPWQWVTQGPLFDFDPIAPQYADVMQGAAKQFYPIGITDPTLPLYSATDHSKGGPARQTVTDGLNDIFFGRRPVSDFDQIVADWKSSVGDTIRAEYQQAYAAGRG